MSKGKKGAFKLQLGRKLNRDTNNHWPLGQGETRLDWTGKWLLFK